MNSEEKERVSQRREETRALGDARRDDRRESFSRFCEYAVELGVRSRYDRANELQLHKPMIVGDSAR